MCVSIGVKVERTQRPSLAEPRIVRETRDPHTVLVRFLADSWAECECVCTRAASLLEASSSEPLSPGLKRTLSTLRLRLFVEAEDEDCITGEGTADTEDAWTLLCVASAAVGAAGADETTGTAPP